MNLKSLSLPQRLAAGFGCVVVLASLVAGTLYLAFDIVSSRHIGDQLARAPRAWVDSLRLVARPMDLTGLILPRTDTGDGAAVVYDDALAWKSGNVESAYKAIVRGLGATGADSAQWRAAAADTALDRFVTAARRLHWRALDRALAGADTSVRDNILTLPSPHYAVIRNAVRGLVIRGLRRAERGDTAGARTDLQAATGLGDQVFRREPSAVGSVMGRSVVLSGAHGWERFGVLTHDTALAARARRVQAWAARPVGSASQLLILAPDTCLALARDPTLVLGMRAEALIDGMMASFLRPRGFLFGPGSRYASAVSALAGGPDTDFALLATMTRNTVRRLNTFGAKAVLREMQKAQAR